MISEQSKMSPRLSGILTAILMSAFMLMSQLPAQSLYVTDVDASNFPIMKAKFYAFDGNGKQVTALSTSDVIVKEEGAQRTVTDVSCAAVPQQAPLSSLLSIDVSGSMNDGIIDKAAGAVARAWINAMPADKSECAVTSFGGRSYINKDFTTDKTSLLQTISSLGGCDGTDYDQAFTGMPSGSLEVLKSARFSRVLVFISDGYPNSQVNESAIVDSARRLGVTVYGMLVGQHSKQNSEVKNISQKTGGVCFEKITNDAEAIAACAQILLNVRKALPCEVEWISNGCPVKKQFEINLPAPGVSYTGNFIIPLAYQTALTYSPSSLSRFGKVTPGTKSLLPLQLTAQRGDIRVDAITPEDTNFHVDLDTIALPFLIKRGESRSITLEYSAPDSSYRFCRFAVRGDACTGAEFYADGGSPGKFLQHTNLNLMRPNGKEVFAVGSDEEIVWTGAMPQEKILLEYSTDAGATWTFITDTADGSRHTWRVPRTPGDRCLARASALSRLSLILDLAFIPSGSFFMGDRNTPGPGNDKPFHPVTISRSFLMGRTEVTQAQWKTIMGANPSYYEGDDKPIENVSWDKASDFCNRLSVLEGLDSCYSFIGANFVCNFAANGYRLPTEAEWEYACRAGTETDFYTGNMSGAFSFLCDATQPDSTLDKAGWYCSNAGNGPNKVGLKAPNAFGLYDMHGNVSEWCWDEYDFAYYSNSPALDPRGGSGMTHVWRGGSWNHMGYQCRSSSRNPTKELNGYFSRGFRVVRMY